MFQYKFGTKKKQENEDIPMDNELADLLKELRGEKVPGEEEKQEEGSVNQEMLALLQDIAHEMKEAKERDAVVLEKVESIQEKIAEMSRGQLSQILSQAERIAKALMESGSEEVLKVNVQALTNTVAIDKEDLDKLLSDAYPTNRDIMEKVEARFINLHNSLVNISEGITVVNKNGQAEAHAIIDRIVRLKDIIDGGNRSLENRIEGVRKSIPNRELY